MALPNSAKLLSKPTFDGSQTNQTSEIDSKDYLNLYPKVGIETGYTEALINADFKYSIGTEGSATFSLIDKDTKHVVYYSATTPTGMTSTFKAYRHGLSDSFIFEPEPISLTFLAANERLNHIINAGTNFLFVSTISTDAPLRTMRRMLVRTNGSSLWSEWTLAYDVTNIDAGQANFSLVTISGVDYILRISGLGEIRLDVFNSQLSVVRSLVLFNMTNDVSFADHTGAGRTGFSSISMTYNAHGRTPGFTWNPFTQSILFRHACYNVIRNTNGSQVGTFYAICFSWSITAQWLSTGGGAAPVNLIPVKSSGKRYHAYSDGTWNTVDGGIVSNESSLTACFITDEYSGDTILTQHSVRGSAQAGYGYFFEKSTTPLKTVSAGLLPRKNNFSINIPDGSPYAKGFGVRNTFAIGNTIFTHAKSLGNGALPITIDFSRTRFMDVVTPKDTLYLDPATIKENPFSQWGSLVHPDFGSRFSTTVKAGAGRYFVCSPGSAVLEAKKVGGQITWSALATVFPVIPTTVGGITIQHHGGYIWNGETTGAVFWALAKTPTYFRMIRYANGVWTIESGDIGVAQIDHGNASRGDTAYNGSVLIENSMLSESGRIYTAFQYVYTGNSGSLSVIYNTNDKSFTVNTMLNQFNSKTVAGAMYQYAGAHDTFGSCYGWNEIFGYYAIRAPINYSSFRFISSKDATGAGAAMTEQQWRDNSLGYRYESVVSASSSVGLVAYLAEYPIFIGGYLTKIPQVSVNLQPQRDNYIYAVKGDGSRDAVEIVVQDKLLSNTFNRICLAKVTTSADKITDSVVYSIDGTGLPDQKERAGSVLVTNGKTPYWGSGAEIGNILSNTPNALMTELRILLQRANAL